jgi:hypothetical protein
MEMIAISSRGHFTPGKKPSVTNGYEVSIITFLKCTLL